MDDLSEDRGQAPGDAPRARVGDEAPPTLLTALSAEAGRSRRVLLLAASAAGVANVSILACINASAHSPAERDGRMLVVFLLLLALYALCARYTKHRTAELIESLLHRIKVRVGERLVDAELGVLERINAAELCDLVTENAAFISDRTWAIANLLQSLVITMAAAAYIAWLSLPAFALIALVCATGAALFISVRREFIAHLLQGTGIRVAFRERLTDLLAGFKELQFSRRRAGEIRADVLAAARDLRDGARGSSDLLSDGMLVGEGALFTVLGVIAFTLTTYVPLDAWTLTHLVAALMFLWGPIMNVTDGLMPYARSSNALAELHGMIQRLEAEVSGGPPAGPADPWGGRAGQLEARAIEYVYRGEGGAEQFRIGPLAFTAAPGEVVFIVGGNGSGKSTLLKVLTSLYAPTAGELWLGGAQVRRENVAAYRDMISAIFSDFHLFPRLYGLEHRADAAGPLLARMRLADKVCVEGGAFTTLALSTGQRKRLAMVVALLEDRPICVFDEWVADQDPEFRAHFYDDLLPELRRAGKVVLVVSHDDRYFDRADRVVHMEYGKVRAVECHRLPGGPA